MSYVNISWWYYCEVLENRRELKKFLKQKSRQATFKKPVGNKK